MGYGSVVNHWKFKLLPLKNELYPAVLQLLLLCTAHMIRIILLDSTVVPPLDSVLVLVARKQRMSEVVLPYYLSNNEFYACVCELFLK